MNTKWDFIFVLLAILLVPAQSLRAGAFPAGSGDDLTVSLGRFKIIVDAPLRPLVGSLTLPGFSSTVLTDGRIESPLLFDPATKVGRSTPHIDGDATDTGGATVGIAGTVIKDADFSIVPAAFEDPGSREVHTEVRDLDLDGAHFGFAGNRVRAGTLAPAQPTSPGEVESQVDTGVVTNDFPADSFFNIFVEIDIEPDGPGGMPPITLYNSTALLVESVLTDPPGFPPKVLYTHGGTTRVPVFFKSDNPDFGAPGQGAGELWKKDDKFGLVVLAGHGIGFDANEPDDVQRFNAEYSQLEEILPEPTSVVLTIIGIFGTVVANWRRRQR